MPAAGTLAYWEVGHARRGGEPVLQTGLLREHRAFGVGQALMLLVLALSGARPGFWALTGPLLLAGLGNGLVIAPNQDFVRLGAPTASRHGRRGADHRATATGHLREKSRRG